MLVGCKSLVMLCTEDDHNSYDYTGITRVVSFHATSQHLVTDAPSMNYYRAIDRHHQAGDESYYSCLRIFLCFRRVDTKASNFPYCVQTTDCL